jgi:GNAT superfamily N-acetyltransferase
VTAVLRIRPATRADVPLVFGMIGELAAYERAPDAVVGDEGLLGAALFGPEPGAEVVIAEVRGEAVGFALFFATFSTWLCRAGMWLEDLYVRPEHRRGGIGRALLEHLAGIAVARAYGRIEWQVLRWNEPALQFYDALGAERLAEWQTLRLDGGALLALGGVSDSGS